MAEHGEAPCNLLYPLYVLNRAHPHDGRDLLQVGFDAMLRDDKTQQHTPWDPKNALLSVEICKENGPRLIYFGFWCLMTNTTKLD